MIDVGERNLSKIECGNNFVTAETLSKIITALEVEPTELFNFKHLDEKEELKKEGLTTETVNASQNFVKAHPSATIYEKYSRQYTAIIHTLIEYLPPKEKKNISRLAALRNG